MQALDFGAFDSMIPDAPAAFTAGELQRLVPMLKARARRFCRDEHESEDLVQETLLRALEVETQRFGSLRHLRAWLFTVLRNVLVSRRRHEAVGRRVFAELEGAHRGARSAAEPEAPFLTRSVERALAELPGPFASVVRLVDLQDHAYEDAARVLDIPVGTVMSRLFRGRRRLAALLAE
jgi:RNA polymerase sigma-70 factor (ECF subfamily)